MITQAEVWEALDRRAVSSLFQIHKFEAVGLQRSSHPRLPGATTPCSSAHIFFPFFSCRLAWGKVHGQWRYWAGTLSQLVYIYIFSLFPLLPITSRMLQSNCAFLIKNILGKMISDLWSRRRESVLLISCIARKTELGYYRCWHFLWAPLTKLRLSNLPKFT